MLNNDIQFNDSIDQEINNLICESFTNLDNDDFDDAVTKIVENTQDNTVIHNDTNSIKCQNSDLDSLKCDQPSIMRNEYESSKLAESVCALFQEEVCACMSIKADDEKKDSSICFSSISLPEKKQSKILG